MAYKSWKDIPGEVPPQDTELLIQIVESLPKDAIIVELGTCLGSSGVAMAQASRGTKRKLFLVDNFDPVGHKERGGWVMPSRELLEQNLADCGVRSRCEILEGNSAEIGVNWNGPAIDFLFIDADHSFNGVTNDLASWASHVKKGGTIALHDYNNDHVKVKDAAFQFFGRFPDRIHWLTGVYVL